MEERQRRLALMLPKPIIQKYVVGNIEEYTQKCRLVLTELRETVSTRESAAGQEVDYYEAIATPDNAENQTGIYLHPLRELQTVL